MRVIDVVLTNSVLGCGRSRHSWRDAKAPAIESGARDLLGGHRPVGEHVAFDTAIDVRNAYEIPIVPDAGDRKRPLCGNLWLNLDRSRGAAKGSPVSRLNNNRRGCRALVDGDEQTNGARVEHYPLLAALGKPHRDVGVLGVVSVSRDQFFVDQDRCRSRSGRANVDVADVIAGALGFAGGDWGWEIDDATAAGVVAVGQNGIERNR